MIGNACLHRRRDAQGLMNLCEVIVHEMKSRGVALVLELLAKRIGQSGHSPHAHPHGQVLPFHKANGARNRFTSSTFSDNTYAELVGKSILLNGWNARWVSEIRAFFVDGNSLIDNTESN